MSVFSPTHAANLGDSCTDSVSCTVDNSTCFDGTCTCNPGFDQLNETFCEPILLDGICSESSNCTVNVQNSECTDGTCSCSNGFYKVNATTCEDRKFKNK